VRALRLHDWGEQPSLTDVALRSPGPDEVVLDVTAAGICHSDLHVVDATDGQLPFRPPFTLGHEVAGRVASIGGDVDGVHVGDAVVVHAPWGCGGCDRCRSGSQNYCDRRDKAGPAGIGLGVDGGMAESLVVASSRLIPIRDLDPASAAPLTDAGLTSYHAISRCRDRLGEGSIAVVVGVGGLGHLAVQILRACTPSRVVAVDTRTAALDVAERFGAHVVAYAGREATRAVRTATEGRGADVVFDFVGAAATLAFSTQILRSDGELSVVGSGGGALTVTKAGALPPGTRVSVPFWGTQPELLEVVRLAHEGRVQVETTEFALSDAGKAFDLLRRGEILGRAVLIPG
jgi:propanol-preferring alcohol dehydrogenase